MGSDTLAMSGPVLAFDTSAAHCAVALLVNGRVSATSKPMERGQAEALMPMIEGLLTAKGVTYSDLTRLAVGVGPGNFTGIRIAVSAARGLAMGLKIPAIGITGFDVVLHAQPNCLAAIPAPRDMAYLQEGDDPPRLVPRVDVPARALWPLAPDRHVQAMAQIAAQAPPERFGAAPAPLYIRPADAAPPRDAPPVILDEPG
ncbi:MAG: tRNA (adenosine(37)-N6)-threonylcarbamoyltransferase complex dimerization subunit type 1 TsaB [Pseudomonadota bacterium]